MDTKKLKWLAQAQPQSDAKSTEQPSENSLCARWDAGDDIETAGDVTHRGDMLQLFENNLDEELIQKNNEIRKLQEKAAENMTISRTTHWMNIILKVE